MKKITFLAALFLTFFNQANAQFNEGFDAGIPATWTVINGGDAANTWVQIVDPVFVLSGTASAAISYGATAHDDYLITPAITVVAGVNDRIIFKARSFDPLYPEQFDLKVSVSTPTAAAFTITLATIAPDSNLSVPTDYSFDLSAYVGQTIYIGMHSTTTDMWRICVDDFVNDTPPACLAPTTLSVSNVTATSVDLSWVDASGGAQFDYEYVVQAAGTGMPASGTFYDIDTLPVTVNSLSPNTSYEFWVRSDCGSDGFSTWAGPFNFTTACAVFTAPFNQPFATNALPSCWSQGGATPWEYGSSATTPTGFSGWGATGVPDHTSGGGGTFIGMDGSDNTDGEVSTLLSPFIDVTPLTVPRLRYAVFSNNVDDDAQNLLEVEVYDGAAWNLVNTVQSNLGTGWVEFTTDLTTLTITGPIQIRYTVTGVANTGDTYTNDILIDDVIVEETPSCIAPTTLAATNITAGSVDLSWVDPTGTQFDFEYAVQLAGTGVPAGAGMPVGATSQAGVSQDINTNALTANTNYEVYVRADCGGGDFSTWLGPITFRTACAVVTTFPYVEAFEADNPCWTNSQVSGTDNWLRDPVGGSGDIDASHGGTGFMEKNYQTSEALLFSPQFDLTALGSDGRVKVWLHRHASANVNDEYIVYVNTTNSLTGATQLLDLYSKTTIAPTVASTGWYEYVLNIPSSFNTSNSVYIIFKGITTAGFSSYDLGVDDFTLEAVPACAEPTSLAVSNLADTSADVSWTATTGSYEYVLDMVATDPAGSGTAFASETYNASGLTQSTTYYFHVRTVCAGSTYSTWSTISFTTLATPPANDECSAAVGLTVNPDYLCGVVASGTTVAATASSQTDDVSGTPNNDVWYSFVASQTAHRISLLNIVAVTGTSDDMGIGVYDATSGCSSLVLVGTSDPEIYDVTGLTIGTTYIVRVYDWYNSTANSQTFDICVGTDPALSSSSFDSNAFLAYPNPVKDVLNLEYNSEMSSVRVMNLLGQEVISRNINANSTQVDMSQLSAGAYIVNVTVGDAVKTIKVVKQ